MFKLYIEGLDGSMRVAVLTRAEMAEYCGPCPTDVGVGESGERVSWATFKAICSTCIPDYDDTEDHMLDTECED